MISGAILNGERLIGGGELNSNWRCRLCHGTDDCTLAEAASQISGRIALRRLIHPFKSPQNGFVGYACRTGNLIDREPELPQKDHFFCNFLVF